jgi:single-strand DNA-binding protein
MAENNVTLVGNVVAEPELRFTNSGMAAASLRLAVNNRRKQANGEYEDEAHFFDVQMFGSMAENAAESLAKGTRIVVQGRLQQRQWESKEGEKRSKVELLADEVAPSLRWATAAVTKTEKRS